MIVWTVQRLATWLLHLMVDTTCAQCVWHTLAFFVPMYLLLRTYRIWNENRTLPPGPNGLPIVGYLPYLRGNLHEELTALSQKHGPVFSIRLGSELMVVLSDHRVIREAFRREEFAWRPDNEFSKLLDGYGIINTEGKMWKDQRRFLHERFRHFGIKHLGAGREMMEARIMTEVETFLQNLARQRTAPLNMGNYAMCAVANVIFSLLVSVRFRPDEARFVRLTQLINEGFKLFNVAAIAGFIPVLRHLPGLNLAFNKIRVNMDEVGHFFQNIVDEHKSSFDPHNIRDVIDSYILEIHNAKEEGHLESLFNGKDADKQMQQIVADMFTAGSETVKTTLEWATLFAVREPQVQAKVQAELDRVVGRRRLPSLDDMPNLPYTEAFIMEVMRRATVVALGTTHSITRTTTLNGHTMPKGAQVIPLLHAVHMNPTLWKDPELFNPDRFINAEGKLVKPDYFMPFGVGRRMCLGVVLAQAELFLFISSLLHVFTLQVPEGEKLPSVLGQAGVTVQPGDFKVCAVPRQIEVLSLETESLING